MKDGAVQPQCATELVASGDVRCRTSEWAAALDPTQQAPARLHATARATRGSARESTVSVHVARVFLDAVERTGVSRAELLSALSLDASQLDAPEARLPRALLYQMCEVAMDLTGDPALGLHWSERVTGNTFVPVSHLIAHSASLRHGFESLCQFERLISDQPSYELCEQGDKVTVYCLRCTDASPRMERFLAEMVVGGFYRLLQSFCAHARPERVSFDYPAPAHHHEYARIFSGAERFEQPFTGIVFDRAWLDAASPQQDEDVHEALRSLAERRLSRLNQHAPYAWRVRELLVQRGWPERIDMETAARSLGLSVRSLRRRLASEGKSYSDIENDALASVAKHLLRDKQRTIQETAYEMGFSDTTTFHRAFKRWTGTTPSSYQVRG